MPKAVLVVIKPDPKPTVRPWMVVPDVELNVPVTAAPADVMDTMVVVPLLMSKLPELSAVVTTPPIPVVIAAIELAIFFPL
jgi:hypothetical protein